MDLPLPEGPTIATNCAGVNRVVERMQDREWMIAALNRFGDVPQLDHRAGFFRSAARLTSSGSSADQTVFSTMREPSALGWMPSDNVQARNAGHDLQIERHERHVVFARQLAIHLPELGGVRRARN